MRRCWWLLPVLTLLLIAAAVVWLAAGEPVPAWTLYLGLGAFATSVCSAWALHVEARAHARAAERWFIEWCTVLERHRRPGRR